MKNIKKYAVVVLSLALVFGAVLAFSACSGNNEDSRSVVYEDMQAAFERSGLRSSNIGIFSKTEQDGSVSYGECGSGGAAINEQMQLIGITPGGYYSADGSRFRYGVLIPASEIKICLEEWAIQ